MKVRLLILDTSSILYIIAGTRNVLISTDAMHRTSLNIPDGSLIIRYEVISELSFEFFFYKFYFQFVPASFEKLLILSSMKNRQCRNLLITEDGKTFFSE